MSDLIMADSKIKAEIDCLLDEFIGPVAKLMWLRIPNPDLNNMRPIDMLKSGQAERLLKLIKKAKEEWKHD